MEDQVEGIQEANRLCQSARTLVFHGVKEKPDEEVQSEAPKEFNSFIPLSEPSTSAKRTPAEEEKLAARKRRFNPY